MSHIATIEAGPKVKFRPGWLVERYYPQALGLLAACVWLRWGGLVVAYSGTMQWHLDQIYSAVFGLLSITTGFLATFYGTIQSMSEGFIRRTRNTAVMRSFLLYLKSAIILGFFMAIATIPMMVITPVPASPLGPLGILVAAWIAGAVCAISGFARVARHTFFIFETKISDNQPGG